VHGLRRCAVVCSTVALAAASLMVVGTATPAGAVDVGSEAAFRAAWATASRIELTDDITLTCAGGGAANRTSSANVELFGEGHTIRMESGCIDRVLEIADGNNPSSVKLDHVTIRGGRLNSGFGGGILINGSGSLEIIDSTFTDNETCADGAAIDMEGGSRGAELEIDGSTLADNSSRQGVGGVAWAGDVATTVVNSTLTDNDAVFVAALYLRAHSTSTLDLQYADVVDNTVHPPQAPDCTGSVAEPGDATHGGPHAEGVDAAAVTGQVQLFMSKLESFGSVLTSETQNCESDVLLDTDSNGYNRASDSSCRLDGKEDEQHVDDPGLGHLADNGGPTKTLLPEKDSPLIDEIPIDRCSGPDDDITEDQRDVHRPQGDACDIGAVELEVAPGPAPAAVVVEPTFTG
jgi:hypothetical protein